MLELGRQGDAALEAGSRAGLEWLSRHPAQMHAVLKHNPVAGDASHYRLANRKGVVGVGPKPPGIEVDL